jgi:hypothetical protein
MSEWPHHPARVETLQLLVRILAEAIRQGCTAAWVGEQVAEAGPEVGAELVMALGLESELPAMLAEAEREAGA